MTSSAGRGTDGTAGSGWVVGDVVVRRVEELLLPPDTGAWLLPEATPEVVGRAPWLVPSSASAEGVLHLSVHSFVVRAGGVTVVVDTGVGNGKTRANPAWDHLDTPYLQRLGEAGAAPQDVDLVVLTHLHTDHVGWSTRRDGDGAWVPTFPRARYLVSEAELAHWSGVDADPARRQVLADSVEPVRDAGQLEALPVSEDGADVAPGVRLRPAPGHTPGQVAVHLSGRGARAVISGDCAHHPVQLAHPDLCSSADVDPELARRTRRALLADLADTGALLLGSHFPPPSAGVVHTDGAGYRLEPVPARPLP